MDKEIIEKIQEIIPKEKIYINEEMEKHTSFKIGGPAECLIKIENKNQLRNMFKLSKDFNIPLTIIGNGSNILVSDKGIKGIVLKIEIKKLQILEDDDKVNIIVGSGEKLGIIAQKFLSREIEGFEFAAGIPGTIGGAIRMNAGAHGKEMKDIVKTVTYMNRDGNIKKIGNSEAEFKYRNSIFFHKDYVIVEASLELQKGNKEEILAKMQEYANFRKERQPLEYPSAGSTFKRGEDFITAKLIDECGLKGYQIGGAQISEKHAGFIINRRNATAEDVMKLIEYTKEQIYNKFGKRIETEIEILN